MVGLEPCAHGQNKHTGQRCPAVEGRKDMQQIDLAAWGGVRHVAKHHLEIEGSGVRIAHTHSWRCNPRWLMTWSVNLVRCSVTLRRRRENNKGEGEAMLGREVQREAVKDGEASKEREERGRHGERGWRGRSETSRKQELKALDAGAPHRQRDTRAESLWRCWLLENGVSRSLENAVAAIKCEAEDSFSMVGTMSSRPRCHDDAGDPMEVESMRDTRREKEKRHG